MWSDFILLTLVHSIFKAQNVSNQINIINWNVIIPFS